jgi:NAD(P)-dependent dehydrogenase (short-subunit alcohol dehydrogenase family)
MTKTVLITGTSTGIGRAAVKHFQQAGWNVAATMRTPDKETELNTLANVKVLRLDVQDHASIESAVQTTIETFGGLDVVVNNAGYGLAGAFEAATVEQIQRQFETNVFGTMAVIRAALPHLRAQRSGTIINITSIGGRVTFPLNSLYHATKFALEGFSESLQFELLPFNIYVRIVEPGSVKTDFAGRSLDLAMAPDIPEYHAFTNQVLQWFGGRRQASEPEQIAEVIYQAATDEGLHLRYIAGEDAKQGIPARQQMSDEAYNQYTMNSVAQVAAAKG